MALALTGLTSLLIAAGAERSMKATVRSVHGQVTYQLPGSTDWKPLRVNQELVEGVTLKSGAGAEAYLSVNGLTSTVKVSESTTITLAKMIKMAEDSETNLKLDDGEVVGSVKKLSANSDYKVTVPNGVASIRGTDFAVSIHFTGNGNFTITFTSVTGQVQCEVTAPPGGAPGGQNRQTLNTGQSWTVTGNISGGVNGTPVTITVNTPATTPPAVLAALNDIIKVIAVITGGTVTTTPTQVKVTIPTTTSSSNGGLGTNSSTGNGGS